MPPHPVLVDFRSSLSPVSKDTLSSLHFAPDLAKALHCECDLHAIELRWFQVVLEHPHLTVAVRGRGGIMEPREVRVRHKLLIPGAGLLFSLFPPLHPLMAPFSFPTSIGLPDCPLYKTMLKFLLLRGKNKLTSFV